MNQVMIDTTDPELAEAHLATAYGGPMKASAGGSDYRFRHVRLGPGPFHIDTRWGYANPGRFAVLYRQAYGQPPSRTLRS